MHYQLPAEEPIVPYIRDWRVLRREVYDRDRAICHVCGAHVPPTNYECGHIIDRMCGGWDHPSNLVVMCRTCNRMKPPHDTRAEYMAWLEAGDWRESVVTRVPNGRYLLDIYLGIIEGPVV